MSEEKNIHEAIVAVMKEVGYVQKQKAAELRYTFAGEAALIAALRPPMVEHGIYMAVIEIKDIQTLQYTTKSGTSMFKVSLVAVIRFTHAPSGTFTDVMATGEGADSGDKSFNKALTGAYKYALRETFCIETGDDPDKYPSEEMVAETLPTKNVELVHILMEAGKAATKEEAVKKLGAAYGEVGITKLETMSAEQWPKLKAALGLK